MFSRIIAGILLICTSPLFLTVGLIIKIRHPGPLFFRQLREGANGTVFSIWKLRTMVCNADIVLESIIKKDETLAKEWEEFGGFKNDPRIAGFAGKLARKLSIDELPQLINIIMGQMAFVGPRPIELYLAESLNPKSRLIRNSVLPGLTGLWQVGPRSDISIRQMQRYDSLYVFKRNACLDAIIILKTFRVVLRQSGV